jgi:hypothetical protein
MAFVTEKDQVIRVVQTACALRLHVMILKAAMVVLLRLWSTTTQTTFECVAKIDLKTGAVGKRHFAGRETLTSTQA